MSTIEVKKCRCGLNMIMSRKVPDVGRCANCDGLQPQEIEYQQDVLDEDGERVPYPRVKTPFDKKYEREIEKELGAIPGYPKKGKGGL